MSPATDTATDRGENDAPAGTAVLDDDWYHEDEQGWVRQHQTWTGDGVYVIAEENDCVPQPWHYAVNESYGLGIAVQGAYRRRVRGSGPGRRPEHRVPALRR